MKLIECDLPPVHENTVLESSVFRSTQFCKRDYLGVSCIKIAPSRNGIFKKCYISFVLGSHVAWKVVSHILGIGVGTCSAVIAALSLSGSTLWNKPFSAYDFTLDVVFLFHKWFVYEVMLSISSP